MIPRGILISIGETLLTAAIRVLASELRKEDRRALASDARARIRAAQRGDQ